MRNKDAARQVAVEMARNCASSNLRRVSRLVTKHYDQHLAALGVTATQLPILAAVGAGMGTSISSLAKDLGVERSTLSRDLTVLKRKGLVQSRAGNDERVQRLEMTARGSRTLENAYGAWERAHAELIAISDDLPMIIRRLRRLERQILSVIEEDIDD